MEQTTVHYDDGVLNMVKSYIGSVEIEYTASINKLYKPFLTKLMHALHLALPDVDYVRLSEGTSVADKTFIDNGQRTLLTELQFYFQDTLAVAISKAIKTHFLESTTDGDERAHNAATAAKMAVVRCYNAYFNLARDVLQRHPDIRDNMDQHLSSFVIAMDRDIISMPLSSSMPKQDAVKDALQRDVFLLHLVLGKRSMLDTLAQLEEQYEIEKNNNRLSPTMRKFIVDVYSDIGSQINSHAKTFETLVDAFSAHVKNVIEGKTAQKSSAFTYTDTQEKKYTLLSLDDPGQMDIFEAASKTWSMYASLYYTLFSLNPTNFPEKIIASPLVEFIGSTKDIKEIALMFERLLVSIVERGVASQLSEFWKEQPKFELGKDHWNALQMVDNMYDIGVHKMVYTLSQHMKNTEKISTLATSTTQFLDSALYESYSKYAKNPESVDIRSAISSAVLELNGCKTRVDTLVETFGKDVDTAQGWRRDTEPLKVMYETPTQGSVSTENVSKDAILWARVKDHIQKIANSMARVTENPMILFNPELVHQMNAISAATMGTDPHTQFHTVVDYQEIVDSVRNQNTLLNTLTDTKPWINLAHYSNLFVAWNYMAARTMKSDKISTIKQRLKAMSAHTKLHQFFYLYKILLHHADVYENDMRTSKDAWILVKEWFQKVINKYNSFHENIGDLMKQLQDPSDISKIRSTSTDANMGYVSSTTTSLDAIKKYTSMFEDAMSYVKATAPVPVSIDELTTKTIPKLAPLFCPNSSVTMSNFLESWRLHLLNAATESKSDIVSTMTMFQKTLDGSKFAEPFDMVSELLKSLGKYKENRASISVYYSTRDALKPPVRLDFNKLMLHARQRCTELTSLVDEKHKSALETSKRLVEDTDANVEESWKDATSREANIAKEEEEFAALMESFSSEVKSKGVPVNAVYVQITPALYLRTLWHKYQGMRADLSAKITAYAVKTKETISKEINAHTSSQSGVKAALDAWGYTKEFVSSTTELVSATELVGTLETMAESLKTSVSAAMTGVKALSAKNQKKSDTELSDAENRMKAMVEIRMSTRGKNEIDALKKEIDDSTTTVSSWNQTQSILTITEKFSAWKEASTLNTAVTRSLESAETIRKAAIEIGLDKLEKESVANLVEYVGKDLKDVEAKVNTWLDHIKFMEQEVSRVRAALNDHTEIMDKSMYVARMDKLTAQTLRQMRQDISNTKLEHIGNMEAFKMEYAQKAADNARAFKESLLALNTSVEALKTELVTYGFSVTISTIPALLLMKEEAKQFKSTAMMELTRIGGLAAAEAEYANKAADEFEKGTNASEKKKYEEWSKPASVSNFVETRAKAENSRKVYLEGLARVGDQLKAARSKVADTWMAQASDIQKSLVSFNPKNFGTLQIEVMKSGKRKHEHLGKMFVDTLETEMSALRAEANTTTPSGSVKTTIEKCVNAMATVIENMSKVYMSADELAGLHGKLMKALAVAEATARLNTLAGADAERVKSIENELTLEVTGDIKTFTENTTKLVKALLSAPSNFNASLKKHLSNLEAVLAKSHEFLSPKIDLAKLKTQKEAIVSSLRELERLSDPAFEKALSDSMVDIHSSLEKSVQRAQAMIETALSALDAKRNKVAADIVSMKAGAAAWLADTQKRYDVTLSSEDTTPYDTLMTRLSAAETNLSTNFQKKREDLVGAISSSMKDSTGDMIEANEVLATLKERAAASRSEIIKIHHAISVLDAISKLHALVESAEKSRSVVENNVNAYMVADANTLKMLNDINSSPTKAPGNELKTNVTEHLAKLDSSVALVVLYDKNKESKAPGGESELGEINAPKIISLLPKEQERIKRMESDISGLTDAKHGQAFETGLVAVNSQVQAVTKRAQGYLEALMSNLDSERKRREEDVLKLVKESEQWVPELQQEFKVTFSVEDLSEKNEFDTKLGALSQLVASKYSIARAEINTAMKNALSATIANEESVRNKLSELHEKTGKGNAVADKLRTRIRELEDITRIRSYLRPIKALTDAVTGNIEDQEKNRQKITDILSTVESTRTSVVSTADMLYEKVVKYRHGQIKPIIDDDAKIRAQTYTPLQISTIFKKYRADIATLYSEDLPRIRLALSMATNLYTDTLSNVKTMEDLGRGFTKSCEKNTAKYMLDSKTFSDDLVDSYATLAVYGKFEESEQRSLKLVGVYANHVSSELKSAETALGSKVKELKDACNGTDTLVSAARTKATSHTSDAKRSLSRLEEGINALDSLAEKALALVSRQISSDRYGFTAPSSKASGVGGGKGSGSGSSSSSGGTYASRDDKKRFLLKPIPTDDILTTFQTYRNLANMNDNMNFEDYDSELRTRMGERAGIFCGNFFLSLETIVSAVYRLTTAESIETDTHQTRLAMGFLYHFMMEPHEALKHLLYATRVTVKGQHEFYPLYSNHPDGEAATHIFNTLEKLLKAKNDELTNVTAAESSTATADGTLAKSYPQVLRVLELFLSTNPSLADGPSTITVKSTTWQAPDLFHYYVPVWRVVSAPDEPPGYPIQLVDEDRTDFVRSCVKLVHKVMDTQDERQRDVFELTTDRDLKAWTVLGEYVGRNILDPHRVDSSELTDVKPVVQGDDYTLDMLLVSATKKNALEKTAITSQHFGNEFRYLKAVEKDSEVNCQIAFPLRNVTDTGNTKEPVKNTLALVMTKKDIPKNTVLTVKRRDTVIKASSIII